MVGGLGAAVDVEAAAPDSCLRSVALRCLGLGFGRAGSLVVDSSVVRPRSQRAVFCGVSVFGRFPL